MVTVARLGELGQVQVFKSTNSSLWLVLFTVLHAKAPQLCLYIMIIIKLYIEIYFFLWKIVLKNMGKTENWQRFLLRKSNLKTFGGFYPAKFS